MKFLGRPPGTVASIFPQMLNHQAHVLVVADAGLGMPEPEAFRELPDQRSGALHQFRGGRNRNRSGGIQHEVWRAVHAGKLRRNPARGNTRAGESDGSVFPVHRVQTP